ncbi:RHS repeat-associated protein [Hamadaea flava]|uniref:Ricin-type beta-trefoil lectin domain protein n=1 Tax=Hamadaea flava TaxID=1742688 RepID=A0ABV8LSC9_9ACTN|nr:RHS repeat-associated protein [Hamadaea flava]
MFGSVRGSLAVIVSTAVAMSMLGSAPVFAAKPKQATAETADTAVPVSVAKSKQPSASQTDGPGVRAMDRKSPPAGGANVVAVDGRAATVGGLAIAVSPASSDPEDRRATAAAAGAPSSVRVHVADQQLSAKLHLRGVALSLSRADSATDSGRVRVRVDYSQFANLYGADYGQRLRLVQLPSCALTTPDLAECQTRTPLASTNAAGAVSAEVTVSGDSSAASGSVVALASSTSSDGATFSATTLSPAYSWTAGTPGGGFSWNYPLKVPAGLGGPTPDLSLSYDSGSVDAQTLAQNGQASWVGEGWDLPVNFIERSYRSCALDGVLTADLCWFSSYNATLVFQGRSSILVRDSATGVWHASDDSGLKVEKLADTSLGNGDNDGEYWKVTTLDGTQYFFGKHKRYSGDTAVTNSVQTEPVFGNNSGEPCYNSSGYAASSCQQAYRWNLDYVVDPRGNSMTYFYAKKTGYVGTNNNTKVQPYVINGTLDHIDYGTRAGSEASGNAPAQVWFTRAERCVNTCAQNTSDYPDTPWDLYCSSSTSCPDVLNPAFWTQYRLSDVHTQVWDAGRSAYRRVDQWNLTHTWPTSGDNITPAGADTSPNLWLQSLTHVGYAADGTTTMAEPAITFGGTAMFNRVDWGNDIGVAPYTHYRITSVLNGTGGQTVVAYAPTQCVRATKPLSDSNPLRCFPQYFKPQIADAGWGWFHKYIVNSVTEKDLVGGSPDMVTSYAYSTSGTTDAALWHHDYGETADMSFTSWALWRGYASVTVTRGSGPQTVTRSTYYRGMDNDAKHKTTAIAWGARRSAVTASLDVPNTVGGLTGAGTKCLDLANGGTANGTNVQLGDCTGAASQVWDLIADGNGAHYLKNPASGRCLDLNQNGTANGTNVQLWDCTNGTNQLWEHQADGSWKNPVSGRCLDIDNARTANGTNVRLFDCSGGWNQMWQPQANGSMASVQATRCVDLAGYGTTNGVRVQTWDCTGVDNQLWQLQADGTIKNPYSGRCIDVKDSATAAGSPVQLWDCTAAANQIWTLQANGTLKNPASGRCLDIGVNPVLTAPLIIADCTGAIGQTWISWLRDADGTQGFLRETARLDGSQVTTSTIHTATVRQTAQRASAATGGQDVTAYMVSDAEEQTRTWLAASSKWRWTDTQTTYDAYGLATGVKEWGDPATAADDKCTDTTYVARDTAKYLIDYVAMSVVHDCAVPRDRRYLSGKEYWYDNQTIFGDVPTRGLATTTKALTYVAPIRSSETWEQQSRTEYDAYGRPTASYDALDRKTTTAYTPATGGPITAVAVTNPKGVGWTTTTTVEPGHGTALTVTDVNGKVTTGAYDPLGRLVRTWQPGHATSGTPDNAYQYVLSGSASSYVLAKTLGPGGQQIVSYQILDGNLRARQSQTPTADGGRTISDTTYDNRGLTAKTSTFYSTGAPAATLATFADTAVGNQHRYTYDALERQLTDQLWSTNVLKWTVASASFDGDRTTVDNVAGGTDTTKIVDALGRTVELWQYQGSSPTGAHDTTRYQYDQLARLVKTIGPDNAQWTYTYDMLDRRKQTVDPDTSTSIIGYDAAGQVTSTTDNRGQVLVYTYDELGRKTAEYAGSQSDANQRAQWQYDTLAKGQLYSSKRLPSGVGGATYTTTTYAVDDNYRPLTVSQFFSAAEGSAVGGKTFTVNYTYKPNGSLATSTTANVAGAAIGGLPVETLTYGYNSVGQPVTLTGAQTYIADTAYTYDGQIGQQILGVPGKQVRQTYSYDAATRFMTAAQVDTESQSTPGTWTDKLTDEYGYDSAGNVQWTATKNAGTRDGAECFDYDYLRRLTDAWTESAVTCNSSAKQKTGAAPAYRMSWTFDAAGNRKTETNYNTDGSIGYQSTYAYGGTGKPLHSLASVTTTGSGAGTTTYDYDASGNTTSRPGAGGAQQALTWDEEGKLSKVTDSTDTVMVYDADGERIVRRDPGGYRTLFLLDGTELRVNADGAIAATRYYGTVGVRTANVDASGNLTSGDTLTWTFSDHHGTGNIAVDSSTLTCQRRRSLPYGAARGSQPAGFGSKGFVGGTNDATGLVDIGARQYDPTIGRFISVDPVFTADDPQSWNGYAYANDAPVTSSDPTGETAKDPGDGGSCDKKCQDDRDDYYDTCGPHDEKCKDDGGYQQKKEKERQKEKQRKEDEQRGKEDREKPKPRECGFICELMVESATTIGEYACKAAVGAGGLIGVAACGLAVGAVSGIVEYLYQHYNRDFDWVDFGMTVLWKAVAGALVATGAGFLAKYAIDIGLMFESVSAKLASVVGRVAGAKAGDLALSALKTIGDGLYFVLRTVRNKD